MKKTLLLTILFIVSDSISYSQCYSTVSCGWYYSAALKSNGTLWAWGSGGYGQLGNGSEDDNTVQTQVGSATNWQRLVSGAFYTLGIKTNGTLWGAGDNTTGQLGIGSTDINSNVFVQIGTATNWQQVASGNYFTLGLKTNGTLWSWGQNDSYQLGDGTCCSNRLSPLQVGTATDWAVVGASETRTGIAIKTNGTIWGWGQNGCGIIGPSNISGRQLPTQLNADTNWATISVGACHILALKTNGTLWSWGGGGHGENGDTLPPTYFRDTPVQIGSDTWLKIAAGFRSSFGIRNDGTLWAWGENDKGQLGDGTIIDRFQPVQIGTDTDWVTVDGSLWHTVALKSNGALWSWGNNDYHQLGNGTITSTPVPTYIPATGCTLDTAEFEKEAFTLNPNPATTEISFRYEGQEVVDGLVIYDIAGRVVYTSHPVSGTMLQASIPISTLQSGTYILTLQTKGRMVASKRFVKE